MVVSIRTSNDESLIGRKLFQIQHNIRNIWTNKYWQLFIRTPGTIVLATIFIYVKTIWNFQELDLILSPVAIEEYLWEVSRFQWHEEQYNIAIISGLFTQSSNLWQMMKMFDSIIWFLLFISTITITFFLTLYRIQQDKNKKFQTNYFSIVFKLFRYLLIQSIRIRSNESFLLNIWSFCALILTSRL